MLASAMKAWVPVLVALIGMGAYMGFSEEDVQTLQGHVPAVVSFVVIIAQGVMVYFTPNK